jgi:2-dehydro-3-deoxyphosphogluconate aldolase / (4S)-4-hydroxy-2-oxoglutarate aldolase
VTLDEILTRAPVIPVLVIEDAAHAVPLGRALVAGGLTVLEVTMRTPVASECIARMAGEVEGAVVGAGTVLSSAMRRPPPTPARSSWSALA